MKTGQYINAQYINKLLKIFKTECNNCVLNIFMLY